MNITLDSDDQRQQQIELNSNEPIQSTHIFTRQEVDIQLTSRKPLLNESTPGNDVNQVFFQPIIDHNWESRYYAGHLVVTYDNFVAYTLKRQSGDDIVCVFYKQVDFRSVINPPFSGDIHDLAFSFSDDVLLACVDQAGHLRIYRIEKVDEPSELQHTLILFVDLQYSNNHAPPTLSWCYFIPDSSDNEDNDAYTIMSVTRGSRVEVLNVAIASQSCISENMLTLNQIENGRLTYEDNNGNVTCVCFSPDGTALGTGTDKGEIKFFSINFEQPQTCRCLHLWIPHEGRSISSLYFLDDHKNLTQDTQLWRYAVSGCDQNRELKVWSCMNWSCLQVIRFNSALHPSTLKASMDLTSRFLVLSDIHHNAMYILTIYQGADNNRAHFSSINAFTSFNSPSLSFAITAADQLNHEQADLTTYGVKMYSIHTKYFQEVLLVFKTNQFMSNEPIYIDEHDQSIHGGLAEDFRFEPYLTHLQNRDLPLASMPTNRIESPVADLINLPPYNINDLLTPNGALANIASLHNGDSLAANPPPTVSNDPLHNFLLGNRTAFDEVPSQQHAQCSPTSPLQAQLATMGSADREASARIISGQPQLPYDLTDKEVADSMAHPTDYPLQFEAIPDDDNDDGDEDDDDDDTGDRVFMPIKALDDDEPVNGTQEPLLLPPQYGDNSHWSQQGAIKGMNPDDNDDYSDPPETSDKDDDSTADEENLLHTRMKRRAGRSPNSSQLALNADSLHEIRQLTSLLTELRSQTQDHPLDTFSHRRTQLHDEEKLEQCCQRLEQLTSKVDRLISCESAGMISRPSRPSPNAAPVEILTSQDSQVTTATLTDMHYDRLEAILIEKIQTYMEDAMKSVFEPYRELKDTLHKDLAAKLLATDNVIKQTVTQIFRSKEITDSLRQATSNTIQSSTVTCYRDTFNQIVIPSFEKAVTNMFQQTNDVFKRGTKEYLQEMIDYGRQQQRSLIQQREQMMADIRKETTQLNKELEKKNQELANALKSDIAQDLTTNLAPIIRETARSTLREETTTIFRELMAAQKNDIVTLFRQSTALQSPVTRTTTPAPSTAAASPSTATANPPPDAKLQHILQMIRAGLINQAFESVLSASNLALVVQLCENVRAKELFALRPCPLQPPVLLSLTQQLAVDLSTQQEVKYSYLHEILICLDSSPTTVRDFAQTVLADLTKKLYTYVQAHPSAPIAQRFQVLLIASQRLLHKIAQQRATPVTQLAAASH